MTEERVEKTGSEDGQADTVTRWSRSVDQAARTVSVSEARVAQPGNSAATSAASTPATDVVTTSVVDLISGAEIRSFDETGRITATGYDAAGRPTHVTSPQGLHMRTSYEDAGRITPRHRPSGCHPQ